MLINDYNIEVDIYIDRYSRSITGRLVSPVGSTLLRVHTVTRTEYIEIPNICKVSFVLFHRCRGNIENVKDLSSSYKPYEVGQKGSACQDTYNEQSGTCGEH